MGDNDIYSVGAYIVGGLSFIIIWIVAITQWGFLIGLALGWFPAMIGGLILGFLWPLILLLLVVGLLSG